MGINPTPTNHRSFTFDGKSTREFGVYITGEGVFNAPERAVEMISIPGRDGEYALDQGHFNNIEVTYRAGIVSDSTTDFAEAMSDFRNWLASHKGYFRLTDEYNPDEYRMAVFKSGVNIDHVDLKTGEFEITFDCKPQRWLTSGETATAVANNGTLSNPTLFDSEPLLAVKGYGTIGFNGYSISIDYVPIGYLVIEDTGEYYNSHTISVPQNSLNNGDTITVDINLFKEFITWFIRNPQPAIPQNVSDSNANFTTTAQGVTQGMKKTAAFATVVNALTFTVGTSSTVTNTMTWDYGDPSLPSGTVTQTIAYNTTTSEIAITLTETHTTPSGIGFSTPDLSVKIDSISANSTVLGLGNPTYIDCEIGECWMESGGEIISLNDVISLGSDLPKLASGTNTFTYDNTVTELKVTPRWWKV